MMVRDITIFICHIFFYVTYLLNTEVRMSKLRELTKLLYESRVDIVVTKEHYEERDGLINSLIADPCLARYDPSLRCYLSTDFSARGFVCSLKQLSRDADSLAAMDWKIASGIYVF